MTTATTTDALQRKVIATLVGSQMLGGVGITAGIAVGTLLTEYVAGTKSLAGLGGTFQVLGSAVFAVPMARVMARRGRRPGLLMGYATGIAGAALMIVAGISRSLPLLLAASVLFGAVSTSNSQSRYAAADLAQPRHRGRDLSIVVWATTLGSVVGPNLIGPGRAVGERLGIPPLTGSFVFAIAGIAASIALLATFLRPDPLLEARRRAREADPGNDAPDGHGSVIQGLKTIATIPNALLGVVVMALGHGVMVSIMGMTPIHIMDGPHAVIDDVGLVISVHIAGMYALSPLTGLAVDRLGPRTVAIAGSLILSTATLLSSITDPGYSLLLLTGLFLLGVGWSCTLVAGSTLLVGALPPSERASSQGGSDLVMGLTAGLGGGVAGVVVDRAGYHVLGLAGLGFAVVIGLAVVAIRERAAAGSAP